MTTREYMYEYLFDMIREDDIEDNYPFFVDKIFNYFESKTCCNCNHWRHHSIFMKVCMNSEKDFGCNKWESKDEPTK